MVMVVMVMVRKKLFWAGNRMAASYVNLFGHEDFVDNDGYVNHNGYGGDGEGKGRRFFGQGAAGNLLFNHDGHEEYVNNEGFEGDDDDKEGCSLFHNSNYFFSFYMNNR